MNGNGVTAHQCELPRQPDEITEKGHKGHAVSQIVQICELALNAFVVVSVTAARICSTRLSDVGFRYCSACH